MTERKRVDRSKPGGHPSGNIVPYRELGPPRNPFLEEDGETVEVFIPARGTRGRRSEAERVILMQRIIQGRLLRRTFREIGEELGIKPPDVHKLYTEAMEAIPQSMASIYRQEQLDILDRMQAKALALMEGVYFAHSNGRVVVYYDRYNEDGDGEGDGKVLEDPMPVFAAIKTIVDIEQRKARLLGLDMPVKIDATMREVTAADIELAQIIAEQEAKNKLEQQTIIEGTTENDGN